MAALASRMGRFNSFRSPDGNPLSDDTIRRYAPSIFASEAHHTRSERYAYIPTSEVLKGLRSNGFEPFAVAQSRTRIEDRREHTRHMIRLRFAGDIAKVDSFNGEAAHEIVLLNSHDGTSSYQMLSGMFRFVCANGMVCGDVDHDIRIRHKGDVRDNVIEGAFTVLNHQRDVADDVETMRTITLRSDEQAAFARAALPLRWDGNVVPVTESQILQPKRVEDTGNSLWATFNRVQENMSRGGMDGRSANGRIRRVRAVSSLDGDTKLNRALWTLAQEMAALKS